VEEHSTVIYRHSIAPTRAFTQLSNELIRHPRLSSDAVRLLTWQLSLPDGSREPLSRTAERARIGGCAFTRAKRELKAEGFVHERRMQGPNGRWITQQLVSSVPLRPEQAVKLMAREALPVAAAAASPQVAPTPPEPAVGRPTTPSADGHPNGDDNTGDNTPSLPAPPEEPAATEAGTLVAAYRTLDPALLHIPRAMTAELTTLTARWLAAGHTPEDIRVHILRSLPTNGTPVRHPGGLLRYLLSDVPPARTPEARPAERPGGQTPDRSRLSGRLAALRECEGPHHTQAHLFRPVADENQCSFCQEAAGQRAARPEASAASSADAAPRGQEVRSNRWT
jgi:hypothetical protein